MKYTTATKKTKNLKRPKQSRPNIQSLPAHPFTDKSTNLRHHKEDVLTKDYQYPATILDLMNFLQKERLKTFLTTFKTQKDILPAIQYLDSSNDMLLSQEGCLRWVYDSNYMNDGQERFEASDDVSFDVRGQFCSFCELSRRIVELKPILYETPTEDRIPEKSTEGFTQKSWVWKSESRKELCNVIPISGPLKVCELSSDLFRALLTLFITEHSDVFRYTCFTYTCGSKRSFIVEDMKTEREFNLDLQKDIINPIYELEEERIIHGISTSINIYEFDPFIADGENEDQCYYTSNAKINIHSDIIYHMSIRIGDCYIICRKYESIPLDYSAIFSTTEFMDSPLYFPAQYLGKRSFLPVFLYGIMYLMGNQSIHNQQEFTSLTSKLLSQQDSERLRKRLLTHKRIGHIKTFSEYLTVFHGCLVGLNVIRR